MYWFIFPLLSVMLSAGAVHAATLTGGAPAAEFTPLAIGLQYRITIAGNWDGASVSLEVWNETLGAYTAAAMPTFTAAKASADVRATGKKFRVTVLTPTANTSLAVEHLRLPMDFGATWSRITGNISDHGELQSVLDGKPGLATANTFTGGNTFTGQVETSTAQAAPNDNSVMNRKLSDARYGARSRLRMTNNISSASTSYANGAETLTLPAGTYQFSAMLVTTTVSTTGGIQAEFVPSVITADTITSIFTTSITTGDGASSAPVMGRRNGANLFQYAAIANADANATLRNAQTDAKGVVTFTAPVTITPRIKQRTATDATNPAVFLSGSFIEFTRL